MKKEYDHTKSRMISGYLKGSDKSHFEVSEITLKLSVDDANALGNCLNHVIYYHPKLLEKSQFEVVESILKGIREIVD